MRVLSATQRLEVKQVVELAFANPFAPDRIQLEQAVLGNRCSGQRAVWSHQEDVDDSPNFRALMEIAGDLAQQMESALRRKTTADSEAWQLYEDLVCFLLYYEFRVDLKEVMDRQGKRQRTFLTSFWNRYQRRYEHFFGIEHHCISPHLSPSHLFSLGFQLRRAFDQTFYSIIGQSLATAGVRASVWQSIFTYDMRRYYRGFYRKMGDYVTLITGPSGTGKELVARAIGRSRYIPFDENTMQFVADYREAFCPVNLSALSPTLIESELFGHTKGSFTGAVSDHAGWLESCGEYGCVFLDEIGDLDARIQVKLLRLLEDRVFQRLGETTNRHFPGKIVAATNRDLADGIRRGDFRSDLYYRICSDLIRVPSLIERIGETPDELRSLVSYLVRREVDEDDGQILDDVFAWIERNLGGDYSWPGNIRELEQCVRNILIRRHYEPLPGSSESDDPLAALKTATHNATLTVEELLTLYCRLAFQKYGSYESAAAAIGIDRRTLRKRV